MIIFNHLLLMTGLDDVVSLVSSTDGFFFDRWFFLPMTLARRIMTAWLMTAWLIVILYDVIALLLLLLAAA